MIIGISGNYGAGKDLVGQIIQNITGKQFYYDKGLDKNPWKYSKNDPVWFDDYSSFEIMKFAEPLKEMVCTLIKCSYFDLENQQFKQTPLPQFNNKTPREILQTIGEGMRELLGKDVWVNILFSNYEDGCDWIITDLRYKNEADFIKLHSGITIRINRLNDNNSNHISETDLDDYQFDYYIDNNGTEEELAEQVELILKQNKII